MKYEAKLLLAIGVIVLLALQIALIIYSVNVINDPLASADSKKLTGRTDRF